MGENNMANRTCVLSGGAGSIGAQFIGYFLEKTDWQIITLDSFRHKGYRDRLRYLQKTYPEYKDRVLEFQHDLTCPISPELQKSIGQVDYILHLAAMSDVSFSVENPVHVIKNNIDSTLTMLEYARTVKPEVFLMFGTDEVLGPSDVNSRHKDDEPHRPSNAYAASKAACEDICYAYWRSYGLPLIMTRTMNNFGEMQSSSKFPVITQKAIEKDELLDVHGASGGEIGTRYYIHSRNAADAILFILNNTRPYLHQPGLIDSPEIYHIVGDKQISNLELAQIIAKLMDKELKYKLVNFHKKQPGHDLHYSLDGSKLAELGWKAPMPFEEGMKQTIEWQRENKYWIES